MRPTTPVRSQNRIRSAERHWLRRAGYKCGSAGTERADGGHGFPRTPTETVRTASAKIIFDFVLPHEMRVSANSCAEPRKEGVLGDILMAGHTECAQQRTYGFRVRCRTGLGAIEAGCKTAIGTRCKHPGMFRAVLGANAVLALRRTQLNGRFEGCWAARRA